MARKRELSKLELCLVEVRLVNVAGAHVATVNILVPYGPGMLAKAINKAEAMYTKPPLVVPFAKHAALVSRVDG